MAAQRDGRRRRRLGNGLGSGARGRRGSMAARATGGLPAADERVVQLPEDHGNDRHGQERLPVEFRLLWPAWRAGLADLAALRPCFCRALGNISVPGLALHDIALLLITSEPDRSRASRFRG